MSIFDHVQDRFARVQQEDMSLEEYLALCRRDPKAYASAAERMLEAIGEPEVIDTAKDSRLSRIFSNKVIRRYPAFAEFHGMEEAIEQIVAYFRHAAQGLEERKQILYLLGPVGVPGRAPQAADGTDSLLCDQGLAGVRVTAGPVLP